MADARVLESKLMDWAARFLGLNEVDLRRLKNSQESFKLQPLTDIHLKSNIRWELEANGNIGYIYVMSMAAMFILIMACVNFMNLSIGKSLALMLISGSIIIFSQLRFFQQKDLGFEKEHLLVIPIKSERVRARFSALKTELLAIKGVNVVMRKDYNHAILKIDSKHTDRVISEIQRVWEGFDQQFDFEYTFLDETLDEQYRAESNLGQAVNSFAVLAVILACLGLFGIAKLSFAKKIKPIGIRKVMGAETSGLIMLLLKDYSRLVIAAVLIEIPICWVVMQNWLKNFEYRISINPLVFVVTGLCLLFVTWLALGYLTYKTVKVNPAETLKDE